MRYFDSIEDPFWKERINFVDCNNVFVGYDMDQHCCEDAGWYITSSVTEYDGDVLYRPYTNTELLEYTFDTDFFVRKEAGWGDGGMVVFRLTAERQEDLYLHIFNSHNGYYTHGLNTKNMGEEDMEINI